MQLNKLQQIRSHIVAWFVLQNSSGGVPIVTETVATNVFMNKCSSWFIFVKKQ